mmetsp:Transcript_100575/g.284903  ORF Transcript_100575/g.284903 Transcript_100575/m.284903 type:complete len:276 (+) Transcript_100575:117-944(+)|eukprot:CAMPEP_0168422890 /NCGR_PEP_ID=MMETSP0228-20121227/34026_1 /TAXON_ID=133427 /ORGANISM="Protoceratium reticulatum, Strain CCCM 535 (=CCMP 1889)" /LENGTH=275 /DNA_ID=CAMNT_0008436835 /DNA_START=103 /DNA_END=930 /DNA_ORIENTATION=-
MADYQKLADCCPPGAEPLLDMAGYKPKGEMVAMHDVQCYVSWPAEGATFAVIVFQDVFGIHSGRHKQFCDMVAEKGYGAVAPDFTGTNPYVRNPPQYGCSFCCFFGFFFGIFSGRFRRKTMELSWDNSMGRIVLDCVVPWIKQKGATKLATVGFCFGGYGAMHCGRFPEIFSSSASFHPSTEGFCKSTKEDDLALCRAVKVPQLVVATSMESARWKPGGDAQAACEDSGTATTWLLEEKQRHGFMMRGDTSNAETLAAIKKYMDTMFEFFEANMK